jgi:hypothetical protein
MPPANPHPSDAIVAAILPTPSTHPPLRQLTHDLADSVS